MMNRNKYSFYSMPISIALLVILLIVTGIASSAPKPNIVHILTDDFGWQDPVCFDLDGDTPFETPNLDKLAKNGRKFMQAYSPSPVCSPSRAAYISGQYPAHTGIYHVVGGKLPSSGKGKRAPSYINPFYRYRLPLSEGTIPKELKKAGYTTAHVGKWHVGGRGNGYPFPGNYGFGISYTEDLDKRGIYYPDPDIWGPRNQIRDQHNGLAKKMSPDRLSAFATNDPKDPYQLDEDGRPFDKTLDVALKWLKKHHDQPFFLNYCTYYVHYPIQTRNRKLLEYYCKKMGQEFPTDPGLYNVGLEGKVNPYYAAMVDTLDWMIGKVVAYLEETDDPRNPGHKLLDNTYIIVSSDNGGLRERLQEPITDNSPLLGGKHYISEGGVRVPFIVSGPTIPKGTVCQTPISLIDLYPTFVDMVGLPPSKNPKLDGCNILPLMEGKESVARFADGRQRESIYFYYPMGQYASSAMRKGNWKIYRNLAPGVNQSPLVGLYRLYNEDGTFADIGEKNNLAETMPQLRDQLLAELDGFIDSAGVTYPYKNPYASKPMPGQDKVPAVLERGEDGAKIWVTIETGPDKSSIVNAKLLYTVNGRPFENTRVSREMWFELPAKINGNRIEATVPPGTSHAALCMVDSEGYLVMSGDQHSYEYRPGLYALIQLGREVVAEMKGLGKSDPTLKQKLALAEKVYAAGKASEKEYHVAIRDLRHSIRNLKGTIPQADNYYLNLFRPGDAF